MYGSKYCKHAFRVWCMHKAAVIAPKLKVWHSLEIQSSWNQYLFQYKLTLSH